MMDPKQLGMMRYWDGTSWTEHRKPAQQAAAPAAADGRATTPRHQLAQQSIWTRSWSRDTWIRIAVYGSILLAIVGVVGHQVIEDNKRSDEIQRDVCIVYGQDSPDCADVLG